MVLKLDTHEIASEPKQIRFGRLRRLGQCSDVRAQLHKRDLEISRVRADDRKCVEPESIAGFDVTEATQAFEDGVFQFIRGVGDCLVWVVEEQDVLSERLVDVAKVDDEPSDRVRATGRHSGDLREQRLL